jgi:hypothetical protein
MLAASLLALLSLAAAVVAQSPATPACVVTCTEQFCSLSDLECLCVGNLTGITACVLASCSAADIATAQELEGQECGTYLQISS